MNNKTYLNGVQKGGTPSKAPSNFHIIINTNLSQYQLNLLTREQKLDLINKMKQSMEYFKRDFKTYLRFPSDTVQIREMSCNFEIGKEKKFLHIDSILFLTEFNQIDLPKLKKYLNEAYKPYTKNIYLNVGHIHDAIRSVKDYTVKDGIPLL